MSICVVKFEVENLVGGKNEICFNSNKKVCTGWMEGWMDGWMSGWVDGWMGGRAGFRIAFSNQKLKKVVSEGECVD